MSLTIQERLLRASWLPSVLRAARVAVFPDNALAPARIPPTSDEAADIRRECAHTIVDTIPALVRASLFATKDRDLMREDVATELDLLADAYINKHLIVSIIELLVVRLFPELKPIDGGNTVD
ncbi:hypothetical protein HII31_01519 [Pseudocercospora fuligena]|uniref:PXA domain-containing protein n=1 Tax=Pseudocercospora fuligena TaxID=685502 RepID=A0A8H6RTA4_9PEZI|nr:hypothetical protein HII31_01519 [Pseudocercospora fuligena]